MNPTFVFSLDRETWLGEFPSRQTAVAEGIRKAQAHPDSISTVYVGQKIVPSPRASGNARQVVDAIARKMKDDAGDIADDFLGGVTEQQVMDLDKQIEQATMGWIEKNDLSPHFYLVEAISEHPVPIATFQIDTSSKDDEVTELGVSDYNNWSPQV